MERNSPGRPSFLPTSFSDHLVDWVKARRALKFPVFKDDLLTIANAVLSATGLLQKFAHEIVDDSWYYRFMRKYSHTLGTGSQRIIEVDREKWATSANIKAWYDMVADSLVKIGIAVRNPDYDVKADPSSRAGQPG